MTTTACDDQLSPDTSTPEEDEEFERTQARQAADKPHEEDARLLDAQLADAMGKQPRYLDATGEDWIDEFALSKYHREIKPGVFVDVYDVLKAFDVRNGALQHLIKKALAPGQRGHKDLMEDLDDLISSAKRAKELEQ